MNRTSQSIRPRLSRSRDSVIFGVCGGLAEYFDLSPWGMRLVWVVFGFIAFPFVPAIYVAMAFLLRKAPAPDPRYEARNLHGWGMDDPMSHRDVMDRLSARAASLDQRIRRMESVVTRPRFDLEDEYRNL